MDLDDDSNLLAREGETGPGRMGVESRNYTLPEREECTEMEAIYQDRHLDMYPRGTCSV